MSSHVHATTKTKGKEVLVDPPSGWRYGFPAKYTKEDGDLGEFLVKKGYPRKDVDFALRHMRFLSEGPDWSDEEKEILENSS